MQASSVAVLSYSANTAPKILHSYDEREINRQEIISNSEILLVAGSETTATLLSGATYYLLQNPAVLHRVQSEVRTVFKNEKDIVLRSISTPNLLPYLEAVLQESLRCYPSIPATLPRITDPKGAVIDGKFVPGNVCRMLPPSLLKVRLTFSDLCRGSPMVHIS